MLLGDPGRRYLPPDLRLVAGYEVRTTTELEDLAQKTAAVYEFARFDGSAVALHGIPPGR